MGNNLVNQDVTELLTVGPFTGLDATTGTYFVGEGLGTDLLNIVPDRRYQSYVTAQGRVNALAGPLPSQCYGLTKFSRQGMSAVYIAASNSGGLGTLQQFVLGGSPTPLTLPSGATIATSNKTVFTQYQNANATPVNGWTFTAAGTSNTLKIDLNLNVTNWQVAPPTIAPTAVGGGAGNILSLSPYYYRYTYSNATLESSPSPISVGIVLNFQQANITALAASVDAQVTTINVYRLGGSFGAWFLVGSVANGTTTFTDNTADVNLTGQSLVLHRDPPPRFNALETHKERVWGFGYNSSYSYQFNTAQNVFTTTGPQPSDLWYSNFTEPWGFDNTNQALSVGRNAGGDVGVGLASVGSILVCFKTKSTWAVFGDTQSDFLVRKLFDIGCASTQSIVKAYGVVYWLSNRGVYSFDGSTPQYLSLKIRKILDGFSQADLAAAAGFVRGRMVWFSFPTQGISLGYDLDSQEWFKLGWATDNVVFDLDNLSEVTATEPSLGIVDSWFAAETDLTLPISSTFTSRLSDSSALAATKRYRFAVLQAPVQTGATANVQVIVDPGPTQKSVTRTVNIGVGPPRHLISLPPNLVGFEAQLLVVITSSAQTEVQRVALLGFIERQLVPQG